MFSMDKSFMPWTILMMVTGAVFITTFIGFIKDKFIKNNNRNKLSKLL